ADVAVAAREKGAAPDGGVGPRGFAPEGANLPDDAREPARGRARFANDDERTIGELGGVGDLGKDDRHRSQPVGGPARIEQGEDFAIRRTGGSLHRPGALLHVAAAIFRAPSGSRPLASAGGLDSWR